MPSTIGYPNKDLLRGPAAERLVERSRSQLEHGRNFRQEKREGAWRQSERQYGTDHWDALGAKAPLDPTADLVVVNISFSTVATMVPYVTGSDPKFLVEPYSGDATIRNARAQGAWLNRFWRTQTAGARRGVKDAAHDSIIYGDGYGKVSYKITENSKGVEIATIEVRAVDPWDIWLDPMSSGVHDARWVAQRSQYLLEELREDDTLTNLDAIDFGLAVAVDSEEAARRYDVTPDTDDEDATRWVEIIEFYDLRNRRLIVFTPAGRLPLKVVDDLTCPIVPLENHWLPKQPYHMGDLEQIWSLQQELNKSRSQMLTHRRRNIAKYLVNDAAIDAEAERALLSEIVGDAVRIKGDRPLSDIIQPVQLSPLLGDAYNVSDLITRDVFEITGINEYLRGATPQIRRTATEASIIEGASNIKSAHKLTKIEEFTRDLGTLVLGIAADVFPITDYDELQLYITGRDAEALNRAEQGERLAGLMEAGADADILAREQEGADLFGATKLTLGPDIFVGVYQVEVVQNSTELRNPIFKEQKYREMAQALTSAAPALAQQGVMLNLRKVYELWFEAAGIQDVDDLFIAQQGGMPAAPPMAPPAAGGGGPLPGMPNLAGLGAPDELLSALNTGALPPEAQQ